jgi:hypothetical protein
MSSTLSVTLKGLLGASSLLLLSSLSISHALAAGPVAAPAQAAVPDQVLGPEDQALVKDVLVLENRFFCHHYGHDPMEKRLERLELITLGATQPGSNAERLVRLKQSVITKDKAAAKTIAHEQTKPDGELNAKTNPPILGTLEWRILKKTYAGEGMDPRLNRMETQLFGMPAQSMSYIDRIERLKKTVGMDIAATPPAAQSAQPFGRGVISRNQMPQGGPMPRARAGGGNNFGLDNGFSIQLGPNGFSNGFGNGFNGFNFGDNNIGAMPQMPQGSPQINPGQGGKPGQPGKNGDSSGYLYDDKGNVTGFYKNSTHSWSWPGNSEATPTPDGQQNVFEAMDQMNRQMNQMMRHLNTPGMGFGIDSDDATGRVTPHRGAPHSQVAPQMPQQSPQQVQPKKVTPSRQELPAYTDPNSI